MARWQLTDRESNRTLVPGVEIAAGFWSRLRGWQFRAPPASGCGLLLSPCKSIHTFWMRFAIDLVWLDREGTVLAVGREVRPWRIALAPRGALSVLELPAGAADHFRAGARMKLSATSLAKCDTLPRCLQPLTS